MLSIVLVFLGGVALGFFGGYMLGWNRGWTCGEATGRDKQWTDDLIEAARRERARRDARGQFKLNERTKK